MTKADFINRLFRKEVFSTKTQAEAALDAIIKTLTEDVLAEGESITFTGFGSFKVTDRAARKGRNPRTGAEMNIPARRDVKFTVAKNLKAAVNG